jgi:DNA-binding SARP family transcriptional activator
MVSVDRLVEDLWPGTPPETATHAVQVYVSQLRKSLGESISRQGPGYALELDPDAIDVHRFTRLAHEGHEALRETMPAIAADALRAALALWRGPALVDFEYEPFAQAEIARLDDLRFGALEDRIDADLSLGRHAELVPEIEALVEVQPLRERPRALLMRALYLAGRQADALAAYRVARETLVDELGIEPGPELRELEAAILKQDESLVPVGVTAASATRTRRLAAVLSIALEQTGEADLEVEDRELEDVAATVSAAATRHGGITERLADGSVVAVFGVPVAHEDDPLRAARAAIEARQALALTESTAITAAIDVGEVVAAERHVSGSPIRSAARLRLEALAGDILVSAAASRRVAHAARLEARGEASVLVELAPAAPAFERRVDTPLVGRKRELAALRGALKRAKESGAAHATLVLGAPGVGKSRLAQELTRHSRGITALSGRCLSYGDGITYWALRAMLRRADASAERDAVLAALDAETPPPAAEIAVLFRLLCEATARRRPLVLVFDDLHWAEPTLLDLVDHVVARGAGRILVVCLAREELLEDRPDFLGSHENAERIALETLSGGETEELLDHLDGSVLDPGQRTRLVETAEGNPFFLEQLVALALEGGLVERALPETVQALLSARLDRLGPGERAMLERGAVVGREFTGDDVVALLEPDAVPTADTHFRALTDRGFVRPRVEGSYAFRHALLQEAVYRSAPKRLRAELHERFADRLDSAYGDLPDLDEFVGYHLEQAYRLRTELGLSGRHTDGLGEAAGRRLGAAGVRASKRADVRASIGLLERATSIPELPAALASELSCELGIALRAAGDLQGAESVLQSARNLARVAGDPTAEARARMESAYVRVTLRSELGDELLDATAAAIPLFEAAGDERLLGRAWLLAGWVHGGHRGRNVLRLDAAERALVHYQRSTWPVSTVVGEIANALCYGPAPVVEAIERCEALLRIEALDLYGRANVEAYLGELVAQTGDFDRARALLASAADAFAELGQRTSAATLSSTILAEVELLAGDAAAAEAQLRSVCEDLERTRAFSHLASAAGLLSDVLYCLERQDEAFEWTEVAKRHSASDDLDALVLWMPVRAKVLARRGALGEAGALATEAARLAGATDALNRHAKALCDLGDVLGLAGRAGDARAAYRSALELYETKGNVVAATRTRSLLDDGKHP